MKGTLLILLFLSTVPASVSYAQAGPASSSTITHILDGAENQAEIARLSAGITTLLADERMTDQATRQMLQQSKAALAEMRDQKSGANAGKLVALAKWMRAQGQEKRSIQTAESTPAPQQQLILDSPIAGRENHLTSLLHEIFRANLELDREAAGSARLEAQLQLYLEFRQALELGWRLADDFLLFAPQWTKTRFPQLAADQKRQFLKDVDHARSERAAGPAADEEPLPSPTPAEQAAYDAAYQFIAEHTPPPP